LRFSLIIVFILLSLAMAFLGGCSLRPKEVTVVIQGDGFTIEPDPTPAPSGTLSLGLSIPHPMHRRTVYLSQRVRVRALPPEEPDPQVSTAVLGIRGPIVEEGSCHGSAMGEVE
jgi:hypothetical protein